MYGTSNISHVTIDIQADQRVSSSIDNDRPGEPTRQGDLVCLFIADVQLAFGYADALANIDAMAEWIARFRAQVAARPEALVIEDEHACEWRTAVLTGTYDTSEGESFDPLPDVPLADTGDHYAGMTA